MTGDQLQSLNTCEVYSLNEDKWSELPPFAIARSQHSVCHFNDKFMFLFGGLQLLEGAKVVKRNLIEPFRFVKEVEVFELHS